MKTYTKDPDAVLDYEWDWSDWLPAGDTIVSASIEADTGITVDSSSDTTTTVTAWLSGGAVGVNYGVTCRITTAGGRTDDRTITVHVKER